MATRAAVSPRRSAALAAALSFVLPGLGQGFLGAFWRGLAMALPVLLVAGFGIGFVMSEGWTHTLLVVLRPSVLMPLLILNAVLLTWRAAAIVDAWRLARRSSPPGGGSSQARRIAAATILGVLLALTLGTHVGLGYLGYKTYDTITTVFVTPEPSRTGSPEPTTDPSAEPTSTPRPTPEPTPTPIWSTNGRLDILLVGGDAGPGRWSLRTDTMILLSIDLRTAKAAMFGIPRNLRNVPLPEGPAAAFPGCGCFPEILNGLYVYAGAHPEWFPGGDSRGYQALQDAVAEMTGLQLDGMLVVTLNGFVRLVDALGGLDMYTPYNLYDASYPDEDGIHHRVIWIPAGQHHFDGHTALAFARSRHQDSDYDRMYRQQLTLTALRQQLDPCTLILRIPELLDIAKDSLWTNIPIEQLPDLFSLGARVKTDQIAKYQFWPPQIPEDLNAAGLSLIREMVVDPFPAGTASGPPASAAPYPTSVTPPPAPPPVSGC